MKENNILLSFAFQITAKLRCGTGCSTGSYVRWNKKTNKKKKE